MPTTTPNGWPYVLPDDRPVEFPTLSQQLAQKLDTAETWVAWTPSVGGATYSTLTAAYQKRGTLVTVVVKGTVSAVSGPMSFSLPVNVHADQIGGAIGVARAVIGAGYYLFVHASGTATAAVAVHGPNGAITNTSPTVPAAWAAGHTIQFTATYRSA